MHVSPPGLERKRVPFRMLKFFERVKRRAAAR
jgi:hypothetical protein